MRRVCYSVMFYSVVFGSKLHAFEVVEGRDSFFGLLCQDNDDDETKAAN